MDDPTLAFISKRRQVGQDAMVAATSGGGGVAVMLPSSPLREPISPMIQDPLLPGMVNMPPTVLLNQINDFNEKFTAEFNNNASETGATNLPLGIGDILSSPEIDSASSPETRHPPLRFVFSGYSLWLELEQQQIDKHGNGDLDRAMMDAATEFHLGGAIPSPHVTALYGIDNVKDDEEMLRVFRGDVHRVILEAAEERRKRNGGEDGGKIWPDLDATGIHVGVEFDGVDGGTMDMAWAEVSLATTPDHEALIDALYNLLYRTSSEEKKEDFPPRSTPWVPHLSICYDNPENFGPNLTRLGIEKFISSTCPTLERTIDGSGRTVAFTRAVTGISLWKTAGLMSDWKCLDKIEFESM